MSRIRHVPALLIALIACAVAPAVASATTIYAASSLSKVVATMAPGNRTSFAGSDTLAFQIEQGAPADVFLSAAPLYAERLHAKGLCGTPVVFALNTLTFVTPASNPAGITRVHQLDRPGGYRLAVGGRNVPLGIYTRTLLGKLGLGRALQKNTVSQYQKATDVVSTIALGSAAAGFVYTTDWYANPTKLLAIPVPASAQPLIRYEACAVRRDGADAAGAKAVIARLLSLSGRQALFNAHFGLPPKT
ncbi:MAG: molybdate ABC transporter substrate-binding protein [Gaiellales bacterium]